MLRTALSPTEILHLDNLYSVLINILFSHKYNSKLILRIEDTDIQRNNNRAIEDINEDLNKIRVNIDESSKNLGVYGLYKQRLKDLHIYKFYIKNY